MVSVRGGDSQARVYQLHRQRAGLSGIYPVIASGPFFGLLPIITTTLLGRQTIDPLPTHPCFTQNLFLQGESVTLTFRSFISTVVCPFGPSTESIRSLSIGRIYAGFPPTSIITDCP